MTIHSVESKNTALRLFTAAFAFFLVNAFSQYALSATANMDQAEQLVLSQDWQLGYSSQPPLYTWLIYLLFSITGPSLFALIVIKVLLLSAFIGSLIGIGKLLGFTPEKQLISLLGLAFIPQYIWESQRDITHSLLATVMAATTLLQFMRTHVNPTISNYLIIGLLAALGVMSKYNYAIFFLVLIITAALSPRYRKTIVNYRSLGSLGVAIALLAPHVIWALNHMDTASHSVHKFRVAQNHYLLGVRELLFSLFNFLTPFWMISILLIKDSFRTLERNRDDERSFFLNLFLTTIAILFVLILLSGAQNIKDRWYQPLLFYMPLLLALYTQPASKHFKIFCKIGVFVLVSVAVAFPSRIIFAAHIGNKARPNLPYQAQAKSLADSAGQPGVIISETKLIGGNMRLFFRNAQIIAPDYDRQVSSQRDSILILCETKNCQNRMFQDWLLNKHRIDVSSLKFNELEKPCNFMPKQKHFLYWTKIGPISEGQK